MKIILFAMLSFVFFMFMACSKEQQIDTQTLILDSFNGIEMQTCIDATVTFGTTQEVELIGDPALLDLVETSVQDERLILQMNGDNCPSDNPIKANITIPLLNFIKVSTSGNVFIEDFFGITDLELVVTGNGNIRTNTSLNIEGNVTSKISGSGDIYIVGRADTSNIKISGVGNYDAHALNVNVCNAEILGSGDAEVTAFRNLDAIISGSGNLIYTNYPTINIQVTGSGEVINDNIP